MNFSDIFKKSFLSMFAQSNISTSQILLTLCMTCIVALYIFAVYRLITRKTFYNKNFNISLAAISMITAIVILTIQSNIVVSLGMVGALSIVRFRTAIYCLRCRYDGACYYRLPAFDNRYFLFRPSSGCKSCFYSCDQCFRRNRIDGSN